MRMNLVIDTYKRLLSVLLNVAAILLIYTLCRLFFWYIYADVWHISGWQAAAAIFFGGMRFDLTAVLYLSCVYIFLSVVPLTEAIHHHPVYRRVKRLFFYVPNAIGIVANCVDMGYFPFSQKRTTCTIFSEFEHEHNMTAIFLQAMQDYWYITVFGLLLLLACWFVYVDLQGASSSAPSASRRRSAVIYYANHLLVFLFTIYSTVIGIRSGFGVYTLPLNISMANAYVERPVQSALVLNTPFSMMETLTVPTYQNPHYYSSEECDARFSPVHTPEADADSVRTPNIVIIILESFSKEHLGFYNHDLEGGTYQGYTPFLDSLLAESYTFRYSFANGKKSIDAMPSVLASIPSFIEPYITTPYANNTIHGLPERLSHLGYYSALFHGAPNGSLGFNAFARACGFQDYFGMTEYNNDADFDGTWAIWDEPFLQYFAEQTSTFPQPFLSAVFTASSHHPFDMPAHLESVFPEEERNPMCRLIRYTDYSLRRYFERVQSEPWYRNTVFVITADHMTVATFPEYNNDKGYYEIPIAFFAPDGSIPARLDTTYTMQQADIMPTLLDFMHYPLPYFAFGKSALRGYEGLAAQHRPDYAVCFRGGVYQIFSDSLMLQFDGSAPVAAYAYKSDRCLTHNILGQHPDQEADMVAFLKALIQQYMTRMIDNRLTEER